MEEVLKWELNFEGMENIQYVSHFCAIEINILLIVLTNPKEKPDAKGERNYKMFLYDTYVDRKYTDRLLSVIDHHGGEPNSFIITHLLNFEGLMVYFKDGIDNSKKSGQKSYGTLKYVGYYMFWNNYMIMLDNEDTKTAGEFDVKQYKKHSDGS
jgi:hypothetical protein